MPPCFAEMRLLQNVWVLRRWLGNFLAAEEATEQRIELFPHRYWGTYWSIDDGNVRLQWFDNGQIRLRENLQSGMRHGLEETWYPNGKITWRRNWQNNEKNGLDEWWYDNGQIHWRATWKNGKLHGLSEGWYSNGEKVWQREYVNDVEQ